jgi:hypothetical protein
MTEAVFLNCCSSFVDRSFLAIGFNNFSSSFASKATGNSRRGGCDNCVELMCCLTNRMASSTCVSMFLNSCQRIGGPIVFHVHNKMKTQTDFKSWISLRCIEGSLCVNNGWISLCQHRGLMLTASRGSRVSICHLSLWPILFACTQLFAIHRIHAL